MFGRKYTREELESRRYDPDENIIIIDNVVYDVGSFLNSHPGGVDVLLANNGKDVSERFHAVGHSENALDWSQEFVIGEVVDEDRWEVKPRDPPPPPKVCDEPPRHVGMLSVWELPVVLGLLAAAIYLYMFP